MDRESFWELRDHIKTHPIYKSGSDRRPQRSPHIQLATFLCRMGGETGLKSAGFSAIAEGTVWLYTLRTCHAIRSLRDEFVRWPESEERDVISSWYEQYDFPGCVGAGDGTYFQSDVKPGENGYAFYCHKGFYAVCVSQATCDHRGLITSYDFGWPGSVQDSRVFRLSHLWQNREEYFRPHEYILVDKGMSPTVSACRLADSISLLGYPLTQYSVRPFQQYDITNDPAEAAIRKEWNRRLSSLRVTIEHVFGRLKGRFPYLRHITGMCTQLGVRVAH
ncbi:hypothetical protein L226DRAFT_457808 [Lentinus tigrinus ALCF2SS1-7]|uniref:DDE Tnp4 domain-containing protein n=1 Tax=Lentinus tigrinus ALCF2SS1-6 TaxID=1328759 RepID=A0A5C2S3X8_9APHY|nr:hypothetical protein L227DRAFT_506829 [Lentinus tigrinus ALCF2SS1-6]RPD78768.1 hypothetical protein L226DRAFT_457808 [Lentinus tigrinus ALCF2SS1-7]